MFCGESELEALGKAQKEIAMAEEVRWENLSTVTTETAVREKNCFAEVAVETMYESYPKTFVLAKSVLTTRP